MVRTSVIALTMWTVAAPAHAGTWMHGTELHGRVDRPQGDFTGGTVDLEKVRAYHCGASTYVDFVANESVDPVAGFSVTVSATGDYCDITFFFDTDVTIDGDGTSGVFAIESTDAEVDMTVSASMGWVALSDWSVVSGTMSGSAGPHLTAWIE